MNEITKIPPVSSGLLQPPRKPPHITIPFLGLLYNYLAGNVGRNEGSEGVFRALNRGYAVWASGRVDKIDVNPKNPTFCHVRCVVKASMKATRYNVYILLKRTDQLTTIEQATCECAAG